jgi:hypothetical protein
VDEADLDRFAASHSISVMDLRNDNYDDYFMKRAKSLLILIGKAMGKPVTGLGGEDVIKEFGVSLE